MHQWKMGSHKQTTVYPFFHAPVKFSHKQQTIYPFFYAPVENVLSQTTNNIYPFFHAPMESAFSQTTNNISILSCTNGNCTLVCQFSRLWHEQLAEMRGSRLVVDSWSVNSGFEPPTSQPWAQCCMHFEYPISWRGFIVAVSRSEEQVGVREGSQDMRSCWPDSWGQRLQERAGNGDFLLLLLFTPIVCSHAVICSLCVCVCVCVCVCLIFFCSARTNRISTWRKITFLFLAFWKRPFSSLLWVMELDHASCCTQPATCSGT